MIIASTLENQKTEKRIAITPEIAKRYISLGFEVLLAKEYGDHLGIKDDNYSDVGVKFYSDEKELLTKNKEILELNTASLTLKDQIQELTNFNDEIQKKEKLDITKPFIDETSVTKILGSIHEKLKTLIEKDGIDLEENENRNNSGEINKVETDQQELF